jgi:murein DD-endopeptidase MepM/ murein hydrolase activator NlpD
VRGRPLAFVLAIGALLLGTPLRGAPPAEALGSTPRYASPPVGPERIAGRHAIPPTFQPPVDGQVVDPFRPPPEPWMAGNRGIEYATVAGTPVRAIGPGVVAFAGPVAGRLVVTVRHPDGLRSSYTGLATIEVRTGARVKSGEAVGRAADRLHLGVRRGTTYLDPASLWGRPVGGGRVVLVPDRPGRPPDPGSVADARARELASRVAHLGLTWG